MARLEEQRRGHSCVLRWQAEARTHLLRPHTGCVLSLHSGAAGAAGGKGGGKAHGGKGGKGAKGGKADGKTDGKTDGKADGKDGKADEGEGGYCVVYGVLRTAHAVCALDATLVSPLAVLLFGGASGEAGLSLGDDGGEAGGGGEASGGDAEDDDAGGDDEGLY